MEQKFQIQQMNHFMQSTTKIYVNPYLANQRPLTQQITKLKGFQHNTLLEQPSVQLKHRGIQNTTICFLQGSNNGVQKHTLCNIHNHLPSANQSSNE